jgi:hypothetical protein
MQFSSSDLDLDVAGRPAPAPAQKPRSSDWELLEGDSQAAIEVRWKAGQKLYRAIARLDDPGYSGLSEKRSDIYRACDEADSRPVDAYTFTDPRGEQYRRDVAAAVARSHMNPDQAAMSDMRQLLREMENDLLYPYKLWQQEQIRIRAHKAEQAAARQQLRLALEALADEPDLFVMLRELVKNDG